MENRKKFYKQVKKIRKKYSLIKFRQSILFPATFFILSILTNEITKIYYNPPAIVPILWILSVIFLSTGIFKVSKCLLLIQEVSVSSEELLIKKMAQAFTIALEINEKKKQEELEIEFKDIEFPYHSKPKEKLTINFRMRLTKGRIAKNVVVWFYIPDEFVLISPDVSKSWRQEPDFVVPNIRTVQIHLENISIGPYTPGTLKVKCSETEGEYFLMYRIFAEGYSGERCGAKITIG